MGQYARAEQGEHCEAPAPEYDPDGHTPEGDVAFADMQNEPPGHGIPCVRPDVGQYDPARHGVHCEAPVLEYNPAEHTPAGVVALTLLQKEPPGHNRGAVIPTTGQ